MKRCLLISFTFVLCVASIGISPSSAAPQAWQLLDGPRGGSVAALALSPDYANDRTVFAGLRGRGIYRSIDGGETWQPSGLSDQVIVDLAISPAYATDHTLFAAAGLSPAGFNIYRSTDGGATWQTPIPHALSIWLQAADRPKHLTGLCQRSHAVCTQRGGNIQIE